MNSSSSNDSSPTIRDLWYEKVLRCQQLAIDSHMRFATSTTDVLLRDAPLTHFKKESSPKAPRLSHRPQDGSTMRTKPCSFRVNEFNISLVRIYSTSAQKRALRSTEKHLECSKNGQTRSGLQVITTRAIKGNRRVGVNLLSTNETSVVTALRRDTRVHAMARHVRVHPPIIRKHSEESQKSTNTTHPKLYHIHYSKPLALNHNV